MIFLIPFISVRLSLLRAMLTALLILHMIMRELENGVGMFSASKIKHHSTTLQCKTYSKMYIDLSEASFPP